MKLADLSNPKLAGKIRELFKEGRDRTRDWRKQARGDYAFYAGDQWEEEDVSFLKEHNRPVVTFNRVQSVINAVSGAELVNRQEVRYIPRTEDDTGVNDMYTETARYIRDRADVDDEESQAFQDASIAGMGVTETWVDFRSDPEGMIRTDRFSPLEFYWDPGASKKNLSDADWLARLRAIPRDKLREMFPGKKIVPDDFGLFSDATFEQPHDAENTDYEKDESRRHRTDPMVLQFQWRESEEFFLAEDQEGNQVELPTRAARDEAEANGFTVARFTRYTYWQAFVLGKTVLDKRELHPIRNQDGTRTKISGFTFRPITGHWDENERVFFGLMRPMKDPQRWSNKFFSQSLDILNSQAKGGILAERGAFDNQREAEDQWADPSAIVFAADGAISQGRITERPIAKQPPALDKLTALAIDAVRQTTGVSIEFLGLAERTQSGRVESSRINQGMVILQGLFSSLKKYRKEQGRVLLHFMRRYFPPGKLIRITNSEFARFHGDPDISKFDIVVDSAPTSANQKQEIWNSLQTILPPLLAKGFPVPPDVLDFAPIPESVAQRMKAFYQEQMTPSEEEQQHQQAVRQLELAGMQAEAAEKTANAVADIMKAQAAQGGVVRGAIGDIIKALIEEQKIDVEAGQKRAEFIGDMASEGIRAITELEKVDGQRQSNGNS